MAMYKIAPAIPLVLLGGLIVKILWLPSEAALQGGVILLNDTRLTHNLGEFGCNQTIGVGENVRTNWIFFLGTSTTYGEVYTLGEGPVDALNCLYLTPQPYYVDVAALLWGCKDFTC